MKTMRGDAILRPAACVIGHPIAHSRSPKLHGYWIEKYGLDAEYRAVDVSPEAFPEFIRNLRQKGYAGANVTMPHKEAAFALSEPDEIARSVGAANTLWLDGDTLRATNTDVEGFLGSLDAAAGGWAARTELAVVIGAGGAAKSVVYGLVRRSVPEIVVANRTIDKAEAIAAQFANGVRAAALSDVPALLPRTGLLVNATSLGMAGHPPLDLKVDCLPGDAVVSDIVYVPLATPLLATASARGLATANGLDMLLHQAVRGFELWFGLRPEVTRKQYDLLAADIARP